MTALTVAKTALAKVKVAKKIRLPKKTAAKATAVEQEPFPLESMSVW